MTHIDDRNVAAPTISEAWLGAVQAVSRTPERKTVHLVVRIADPTAEVAAIRGAVDRLIEERNAAATDDDKQLNPIDTVRNTIFPAAWARRHPEPADLAAYYRQRYGNDGLREFRTNARGTYFGRLVAYPRGASVAGDQLSDTVRKLRDERRGNRPKSSRYEINVYHEELDRSPMSFPCLSFLQFHLHAGALHAHAIYRNEYLLARGYGNYLGVGQLQDYIATACELGLGDLMITAGHVELDAPKRAIERLLDEAATAA
jgi:thymidylate synthase